MELIPIAHLLREPCNTSKMKNMKKFMTIGALLISGHLFSQGALGEVIGTILEKNSGETAYGAVAYIDDHGTKYQSRANEDGRFRITAVPPGTYILQIRHKGDTMKHKFIVEVPIDGFYQLGKVDFISSTQEIGVVTIIHQTNALKLIDGNLPVRTLTAEEIERSPLKNDLKGLISSMTTDISLTSDGELVFRGARKGDMLFLVDGVKTASIQNVPSSSIGSMMVYTGGLPAKYGDTLGGVVVMESKSYFDLYRKWEAKEIRAGNR
jgi:hypothetical protein